MRTKRAGWTGFCIRLVEPLRSASDRAVRPQFLIMDASSARPCGPWYPSEMSCGCGRAAIAAWPGPAEGRMPGRGGRGRPAGGAQAPPLSK